MVRPIELIHHHRFVVLLQCAIKQHTLPKNNQLSLLPWMIRKGGTSFVLSR